jgi:hypothetical protein
MKKQTMTKFFHHDYISMMATKIFRFRYLLLWKAIITLIKLISYFPEKSGKKYFQIK